jgi:hypothetical protein
MSDGTHAPGRRSWIASANGHPDFPIQNLPFGVFVPARGTPRGGVAIGDESLDLSAGLELGLFEGVAREAAGDPDPLPYLLDASDQAAGALDIDLEVWLLTEGLASKGLPRHRLSGGNANRSGGPPGPCRATPAGADPWPAVNPIWPLTICKL